MYALLLQSVLVLTAMEAATILCFVPVSLTGSDSGWLAWIRLEMVLFLAEIQFHEVTWAVISCLRYDRFCNQKSDFTIDCLLEY